MNYHISIINVYYTVKLIYSIIIVFLIKASTRNAIRKKMWQLLGLLLFPVGKEFVKHFVQCHIFARSPPGRRPIGKYPVNTSHRSDLCTDASLQCYFVATIIHIQSVCSKICLYIHICTLQYGDAGRAKEINP